MQRIKRITLKCTNGEIIVAFAESWFWFY